MGCAVRTRSWEEEQEALTDGSRARRELWEGYQRMVHGVVRSCIGAPAGRGDYDDMVQVAFEALLSTAEIFDPSEWDGWFTGTLLRGSVGLPPCRARPTP